MKTNRLILIFGIFLSVLTSCNRIGHCDTPYFWCKQDVVSSDGGIVQMQFVPDNEYVPDFWLNSIEVDGEKVNISSLGNLKKNTYQSFAFQGDWYKIERKSQKDISLTANINDTKKHRTIKMEFSDGTCKYAVSIRQTSYKEKI